MLQLSTYCDTFLFALCGVFSGWTAGGSYGKLLRQHG